MESVPKEPLSGSRRARCGRGWAERCSRRAVNERRLDDGVALDGRRPGFPAPARRGAASRCRRRPTAGVVETTRKSPALSFVSCGVPVAKLRTKLYCEVLPAAAGRAAPSRSRSQLLPVLDAKPTASLRVVERRGERGRVEEGDVAVGLDFDGGGEIRLPAACRRACSPADDQVVAARRDVGAAGMAATRTGVVTRSSRRS